jgi:hypothetical protein
METCNACSEILRAVGRIEGRLDGIQKLSERVTQLEAWQSWIKGAWAALAAGYAYLLKTSIGKGA